MSSRLVSLEEVESCILPPGVPPIERKPNPAVQFRGSAPSSIGGTPRLELLREIPGILKTSPEENVWTHPLLPHGVPRGAITEVARANGTGRTAFVLELLAAHPEQRAAWVEDEISVYPPALPLYGVAMERLLFVEAGHDLLWATQQVLRSQLFPIVVVEKGDALLTENDLRRLQILAHQGNTSLLLLCDQPARQGAWLFKRRA